MPRTAITIDPAPLHPVSPDLWGIFLEDINDALDGGLNAELVRNGDFEFTEADRPAWGPLTGWSVRTPAAVRTVQPREGDPLHPANAVHVRVTGPTILANEGFSDGIPVTGETLRLRLAVRRVAGSAPVTAAIAHEGTDLTVSVELAADGEGWSVLEADLLPITADGPAASAGSAPIPASVPVRGLLELRVADGDVVDLDIVSLRPLDPDGTPRTFRPDLVAAIADLSPSFARFPGGCLAHGIGLANMYDWKGSIGPREERRQLPNPWGYHQSRAIGFLEMFALCEEIGATPVPVLAAGVCCQNTPGGPRALDWADMPAYTQDLLDLVEFANGPAESTWGGLRASLGHPEPFGMRYLGVGNEDEITEDFRERYVALEDALRAAHPEIEVIGTSGPGAHGRDFEAGWRIAAEQRTALVDEHYYDSPLWFHQNLERYDAYDRSGPAVYLGEYAARSSSVRSALAEAAHMIAMERNSDVVRLASYAPLLARKGHTQWTPDLIYFDDEAVQRTASWHVQRIFAAQRGEQAHAARIDGETRGEVRAQERGEITLHPSRSGFDVTGIRINGADAPDAALPADAPLSLGIADLTDLDLSVTLTRRSGEQGLTLHLGDGDGDGVAYRISLGPWKVELSGVGRRRHGIDGDVVLPRFWPGFTPGRPVPIRVRIRDGLLRVEAGGELLHEVEPSLAPEQLLVAGAISRAGAEGVEHVVRLVNATSAPRSVAVAIPGRAIGSARVTVLAGAGPEEGAPFEESPVAPAEADVAGTAGALHLDLAPWSLTSAVVASEPVA